MYFLNRLFIRNQSLLILPEYLRYLRHTLQHLLSLLDQQKLLCVRWQSQVAWCFSLGKFGDAGYKVRHGCAGLGTLSPWSESRAGTRE
jgi:hypothetical protein